MSLFKKIIVMALLGAIGAALGAAAGEPLFDGPVEQRTEPRRICLLFDVSGSMGDRVAREVGAITQLEALKEAAKDFVSRQDLMLDEIGLAVFASDSHVVRKLGQNATSLHRAMDNLNANGGTNLGRGFDVAGTVLRYGAGEPWVIVFTDGKPETSSTHETPEGATLSAARRLRESGINIVAIGTKLADKRLLEEACGSPENVIISDPRKLQDAFQRSEEVIDRQMLASTAAAKGFVHNVMIAGAWAALIAIGAAAGLVIGQNRHMRRRMIGLTEMFLVIVGGVLTGLVSGSVGQTLFYVLSEMPQVASIGRLVAWTLLGCGIGFGMGSFVPNLHRHRATVAGAAGGIVAVVAFVMLTPVVGDTIGRLLGAAILGLSTGLMMVLVEAVARASYLAIHWSPKEHSSLTLGTKPIIIGSSGEAHVLIPEDASPAPIAARIWMERGAVIMEDHQRSRRELVVGEELTYGPTRIVVCGDNSYPPAPKEPAAKDRVQAARNREMAARR